MEKNKKDIWFPAKKYGMGWDFTITWQGWLVLLFYVLLVLFGVRIIVSIKSSFGFVFLPIYIVLLSVVLILICKKKGEYLDLRWGDKKKSPKF